MSSTIEIPIPATVPVLGADDFTNYWQQREGGRVKARCILAWLDVVSGKSYEWVRSAFEQEVARIAGERILPYAFQCDHGPAATANAWNATFERLGYRREGSTWKH